MANQKIPAAQAQTEDKFFPASTEGEVRRALLGRILENIEKNGDREDFKLLSSAYCQMFVSHEVHRVETIANVDTLVLVETLMGLYHEVSGFLDAIDGEELQIDQSVAWRLNRVKEAHLAVKM